VSVGSDHPDSTRPASISAISWRIVRSASRLEPFTDFDRYRFFPVSSVPRKSRISQDPDGSFLSDPHTCATLSDPTVGWDGRWDATPKEARFRLSSQPPKSATSQFPVGMLVAESKGFEPLEHLRAQRFSRRLHSPPVPSKTPSNRDLLAISRGFVASLRVPIMAILMAKTAPGRLRQPPKPPTPPAVRTWTHADIDVAGGAALARSAPAPPSTDAFAALTSPSTNSVAAGWPFGANRRPGRQPSARSARTVSSCRRSVGTSALIT
jgi:hypothetical protein